ncbi:MAG: GatB/YqeY domain-containing protein [Clostridia bacterium]|nr:GatB/YqeY domain-containing protein [Clostridia bacterium]
MSLKDTFMEEMKNAMKEKDELKKNVVTMVRSAIKQYEVDNRVELDDAGVLEIVAKEVKKRKDSLPEYEKSGRTELIENLNREIAYLAKYLPEQLSEAEVREIVASTIQEIGAAGMKDMGKVMSAVIAKTKGRADGKVINGIVKELLNA